jgi:hypothetical protein
VVRCWCCVTTTTTTTTIVINNIDNNIDNNTTDAVIHNTTILTSRLSESASSPHTCSTALRSIKRGTTVSGAASHQGANVMYLVDERAAGMMVGVCVNARDPGGGAAMALLGC